MSGPQKVRRNPLGYASPSEVLIAKSKAAAKGARVDHKQEDGPGASKTTDFKLAGNFSVLQLFHARCR